MNNNQNASASLANRLPWEDKIVASDAAALAEGQVSGTNLSASHGENQANRLACEEQGVRNKQ